MVDDARRLVVSNSSESDRPMGLPGDRVTFACRSVSVVSGQSRVTLVLRTWFVELVNSNWTHYESGVPALQSPPPDVPSPLATYAESRPSLLRALGPGMAIAMVVGNVIGSGIFLKPGNIAASSGHFPTIISAWLIGGAVCLLGALCFAELAVMLPRAGGQYVYLREAYGRPVAFLFGWTEFLFGKPASIGALAVAFVGALDTAAGLELGQFLAIMLALGLIAGMAWINIIGVIWGGRMQAATTIVKAGFVGMLALLPLIVLAATGTGGQLANFRTTIVPDNPTFTGQLGAVMLAVMWAYNGWHGITPVAEEVRDPQKNIPLALFGGIGILIALYVSVNIAYHGVLTMEEMKGAGEAAAQTTVSRLLLPIGSEWAHFGVAVITGVIMCSTFGAINSNMLNGPRVSFAMGRDDVFLRQLGRVHVNYRTPAIAIAVQAVMSGVLVVAAGILVEFVPGFGDRNVFAMLTDYVVFSASIFYMLAVLAVIVLRVKRPQWERSYRTLGYPLVPLIYLAFYTWFLYQVYLGNPRESQIGLILIAAGVPFYLGWKYWAARHPEVLHDGQ